jgi:hypothetical protein
MVTLTRPLRIMLGELRASSVRGIMLLRGGGRLCRESLLFVLERAGGRAS